ncbi:MAG: PilZ domain-containing protein, partial [Myxococcota bacterium]
MEAPPSSDARAQRHAVNLFVGYDIHTPPFGRTRDLSHTGIFVETDDRPDVGAMVDIHMVWGDEDVTCQARVARHSEEGIGLAFV